MIPNLKHNPLVENLIRLHSQNDGFMVCETLTELGTIGVMSGKSFVFLEPIAKIFCHGGRCYLKDSQPSYPREVVAQVIDGLDLLRSLILRINQNEQNIPFIAGYIGYEFGSTLEQISLPTNDRYQLPDFLFYLYRKVIVVDPEGGSSTHTLSTDSEPFWHSAEAVAQTKLENNWSPCEFKAQDQLVLEQHSNFSRNRYTAGVAEIIERILDGKVYQVNLTQNFALPYAGRADRYYSALKAVSPSNFASFLHSTEVDYYQPFSIASSSPELFFGVIDGNVHCAPIKGTRPRGLDLAEDQRLAQELKDSQKDRAELAMIVDLVRNDLGRVAQIGTVQVLNHAQLESLPQLHHLVSQISCVLDKSKDLVDIIQAMFPCGSITGCPKIASMNIIAELEATRRGPYTGSIGFIGANNLAEFNVAIRTAILKDGRLIFQTGGGIVVDSEPEQEYLESIAKAKGLYLAWRMSQS